ncbi:MAG TPA: ATP-binding protein [Verrucomicrobiae bacterium]|jgi:signal transduction histidine kinase/CheY-like chemotaxis protein|nr:ATP-binding protein [Verrucomicrobiae bacterium]
MRRETDFVLEQAAWPALLLDENGRICRANQAARRIFGFTGLTRNTTLASIWDENSGTTPDIFLRDQTAKGSANVKLRIAGGAVTLFVAHVNKVVRQGQLYLVIQLLKDSGASSVEIHAAILPKDVPKPAASITSTQPAVIPVVSVPAASLRSVEEEFLLQNAEWPSLLVHLYGKVLRANLAAVRAFGSGIEREDGNLGMIWSPQNHDSAQHFLNLPPPADPLSLIFILKSGLPGNYAVRLSVTARLDVCLLQLFKEPSGELSATPPKTPVSKGAAPALATNPSSAPAVDSAVAQKQKLDCALQMARSVALDFNNALTSILGHASLLLGKAESGHPWRNSLAEIEKSASKAAEIAADLAAFSRPDKDARTQVAGNLNALLERTVEAFQTPLQKNKIALTLQLESKLFTATFDEAKLQQGIAKILENAVESFQSGGKIAVQTRNMELSEPTQDRTAKLSAGNYVCVEISDTGCGITTEAMPRIFEPFFTTKGSRHRGLGLAWVYGILTNHGGAVAVSSTPGAGTAVRLYLPATRGIVRAAAVSSADLTGHQTILFVDDEDLLLTMGQMVLSSFGYTVLTANSGQKALEILSGSKRKIDLVITDLVMPNMSGRELTEHILRAVPEMRILWSSGYSRSSDSQLNDRFLQKPFTSQDLLRKVKEVLSE